MKLIKKYEELRSSTYKNAGRKLRSIGKYKRGQKLIDYSNTESYGVYNFWVLWSPDSGTVFLYDRNRPKVVGDESANLPIQTLEFTNPYHNFRFFGEASDSEDLVEKWSKGDCDLGFDLEFLFEPMGSTHNVGDLRKKISGYSSSNIKLFTIRFTICSSGYSSREYDDIYSRYRAQWSQRSVKLVGDLENSDYSGIFSDRKSAVKFKNGLYKETLEKYHDQIFDIFSVIGADSSDFEDFMYRSKNLRVNFLYDDEMIDVLGRCLNKNVNEAKPFGRWYSKDMSGQKPQGFNAKYKNYYPPTEEEEVEKDDFDEWE